MNWVAILTVVGAAFFMASLFEAAVNDGLKALDKDLDKARSIRPWIEFSVATLLLALAAGIGLK